MDNYNIEILKASGIAYFRQDGVWNGFFVWICFCHCLQSSSRNMSKIEVRHFLEKSSHSIRAQIKNANVFDKAKALTTLICVPFLTNMLNGTQISVASAFALSKTFAFLI